MVGAFELLHLCFGVVVDDHAKGPQYAHDARRPFIQILTDTMLKQGDIDKIFILGDPDPGTKASDCLRGIALPSHSCDGGHSGIVPPSYSSLINQFDQSPLT